MAYIDFKELKAAVPIVEVAKWLQLDITQKGDTWRGHCPFCESGGDRALVITPAEKSFCCHGTCDPKPGQKRYGGDIIELVARMQHVSPRDAAQQIAKRFNFGNSSNSDHSHRDNRSDITKPAPAPATDGLQPLDHLKTDHPAIEALGLTVPICEALGIGYAAKGIMRGRIAFPIRLSNGALVGYQGLATSPDQTPLILFPKNLAEKLTAKAEPAAPADEKVVDFKKFYRAS